MGIKDLFLLVVGDDRVELPLKSLIGLIFGIECSVFLMNGIKSSVFLGAYFFMDPPINFHDLVWIF